MKLKKLPLHVAIVSAVGLAAGGAFAGQEESSSPSSSVSINKDISYSQDVEHRGYIQTLGLVLVDSSAASISDVKQKSSNNTVHNAEGSTNDATANGDALRSASGNIGLNVAAGDNNIQQNSSALSNIQSRSNSPINVETGYETTIHDYSESNGSFDHERVTASSSEGSLNLDASLSGNSSENIDFSANKAHSVDATGTYDHSQSESAASNTNFDLPVTGTVSYESGISSEGSKEMELPLGRHGDLEHSQDVNWSVDRQADLDILEPSSRVDPGKVTGSDSASADSATDIAADFSTSSSSDSSLTYDSSSSSDASLTFNLSGQESSSSDSTTTVHKDSHEQSTYEYHEYAHLDAQLVFGAALDAETFSRQIVSGNVTNNHGVVNNAALGENVAQNAAGNIGINITAGNNNAQANQLALAAGTNAVMATATASSEQYTGGNETDNSAKLVKTGMSVSQIQLTGEASGTYEGWSDQWNDVYLDAWGGGTHPDNGDVHPSGEYIGHVDMDRHAQGAANAPGDAFDDPENGGALLFKEAGEIVLSDIRLEGSSVNMNWALVDTPNTNNAFIGGNALRGATGNIGVNVSAGTNNLQGNTLAMASIRNGGSPMPGPGNGGGEQ